jgi:hypothetical protein
MGSVHELALAETLPFLGSIEQVPSTCAARALGLGIPQQLLAVADEVIE